MTNTSALITPVRVLMIGKREDTMRVMAQSMTPQGMLVSYTQSVGTACREFNGNDFDVVVLGRSLTDSQRTELGRTLLDHNSGLSVVQSFGPYGQLVGPQVAQAAIAAGCRTGAVQGSSLTGRTLTFTQSRPGRVTVTVLRHTFHLSGSTVHERQLPAGDHTLRLSRRQIGLGRWIFVAVAVDGIWQAVHER